MSATTSAMPQHRVWVQEEGYEAMSLIYEPHTTLIDDLKQMVFNKNRHKYRAFFRQQFLRADEFVPNETSYLEPISFRSINTHRCKFFPLL